MTTGNDNYPPRPSVEDPLMYRLMRNSKTPSEWSKTANQAEQEEKWGDAYYYWTAACSEHTRSHEKRDMYKKNANECLTKWRKDNV